MSNVCCGMFNVVVKAPDDLLTKTPNLNGNDLAIRSFRQWVVLQVHRTSHNIHSIFNSFGCRSPLQSLAGQVQAHYRKSTFDRWNLMGNAFRHHDPVTFADSFRNPALDRSPAEVRVIGALFFNEFPTSHDCAGAIDDIEQLRFLFMNGSRLTYNAVFHVDGVRTVLEHALSQRTLIGRRFADHRGHFRRSTRLSGGRGLRRGLPDVTEAACWGRCAIRRGTSAPTARPISTCGPCP